MNVIDGNFNELIADTLKTTFNREDFLKTAFLQYMVRAYNAEVEGGVLQPIC